MAKVTRSPGLRIRNQTATYKWGGGKVDYAQKIYKQRNWIETTLETFDLGEFFIQNMKTGKAIDSAFLTTVGKLGNELKKTINEHDYKLKSRGKKRFRPYRTYGIITDSGALAKSLKIKVRSSR